jgi:hypothetical protein
VKTAIDEVTIEGKRYVPADSVPQGPSDIRIVVLQRGWVMVGRWSQDGEMCALDNASVIRMWGTTKGLGEIALNGPTSTTTLDACGHVDFHILTTVVVLNCKDEKWSL